MWIPTTEQEILAAIETGSLTETASFDAKAQLPSMGKSKDLAVDVAAMTSDGGTLLYGVGENEDRRPTVPQPFRLAGARERVDQIVRTSISEPPDIQVCEIPTGDDPDLGYLVIAVAPSPRAPHMVTKDKEYRYYGRSATGNVRLNEGEVARLYERRRRWEVNRDALLQEAVDRAPIDPREGFAYLHLVARPMVPDEGILNRARGEIFVGQFLNTLISTALGPDVFQPKNISALYPDLSSTSLFSPSLRGWKAEENLEDEMPGLEGARRALVFEIGLDGSGYLFGGGAAEQYDDRLLIYEDQVAGLTVRFLHVLGGLYEAANYLGPVDVGLALTGLRNGVSAALEKHVVLRHRLQPYDDDSYLRTGRFMASVLRDHPQAIARDLVLPLTRVITMERYDPLAGAGH